MSEPQNHMPKAPFNLSELSSILLTYDWSNKLVDQYKREGRPTEEATDIINIKRSLAAAYIYRNPGILSESDLSAGEINQLLIKATQAEPRIIIPTAINYNYDWQRREAVKIPGKSIDTFYMYETIDAAMGEREVSHEINLETRERMLRAAAPELALKHSDLFLINLDTLSMGFGAKERSLKPDDSDRQEAFTQYLEEYHPQLKDTKTEPFIHAYRMIKDKAAIEPYLEKIGIDPSADGMDKEARANKIDQLTTRAFQTRIYGEDKTESYAFFDYWTRTAVSTAATHHAKEVLGEGRVAEWSPAFQGHPSTRNIIAKAMESAPETGFKNISEWLPLFKENTQQAKNIINSNTEHAPAEAIAKIDEWLPLFQDDMPQAKANIMACARKQPTTAFRHTEKWMPLYQDEELRNIITEIAPKAVSSFMPKTDTWLPLYEGHEAEARALIATCAEQDPHSTLLLLFGFSLPLQ